MLQNQKKYYYNYFFLPIKENITYSYDKYKKIHIDKHMYKCENSLYSIIVYNYASKNRGEMI